MQCFERSRMTVSLRPLVNAIMYLGWFRTVLSRSLRRNNDGRYTNLIKQRINRQTTFDYRPSLGSLTVVLWKLGKRSTDEELFSKTHSFHFLGSCSVDWVSFGKELFDCFIFGIKLDYWKSFKFWSTF